MDRTEASKLVTIALAARPTPASFLDGEAIEDMVTAWFLILEDIPYSPAESALVVVLASEDCTGKLPGPELVRRRLMAAAFGKVRAGGEAWAEFRRFNRLPCGRAPKSTDTADPVLWEVTSSLGWSEWGQTTSDAARASYRARFIELYEQLAERGVAERNVATLPAAQRLESMAAALALQLGGSRAAAQLPAVPVLALHAGQPARKAGAR